MTDLSAAPATVGFHVNGTPVTVRGDHPHLLSALREELDITSPKDGCSPSGQCGCCTVHVDGKAVVSCQQPLAKVAGKHVTTLEGVAADERAAFAWGGASFMAMTVTVAFAGAIMVLVDLARVMRGVRAELRAK